MDNVDLLKNNVYRYTASSLEELLTLISSIGCAISTANTNHSCAVTPPLWYRGHGNSGYSLLPSLFRKSKVETNSYNPPTYSVDHLREDYRYHHFKAKVSQQFNVNIQSKIEWEEVMQHHFIKTRLMDWSESLESALAFALEPFLNMEDSLDLRQKRQTLSPSIWILRPERLNSLVYDTLCSDINYALNALSDIAPEKERYRLADSLLKELKNNKHIYFTNKENGMIDGIVSLSAIDSYRAENSYRLYDMIKRFEFNPFFYLLARYYSDGIYSGEMILPPLAIVHPYHSERIKAQHGVFTVTPHHKLSDLQQKMQEKDLDVRAMEFQDGMNECLFEIRITNKQKVAHDLLLYGLRRSRMYPEPELYAKDIEAKNIYT